MIVWDVLFKVINFVLGGLGDTNSGASVVEKTTWWITTDVPKTKRTFHKLWFKLKTFTHFIHAK